MIDRYSNTINGTAKIFIYLVESLWGPRWCGVIPLISPALPPSPPTHTQTNWKVNNLLIYN